MPAPKPKIEVLEDPLWERQYGENDKAYNAFVVYRDMKPCERTIVAAAAIFYGRKPDPDERGSLPDWAKIFRWTERVNAFDSAIDRKRLQAQFDEIEAMGREHVAFYRQMFQFGGMQFMALAQKYTESGGAEGQMSYMEIASWMERATRGQRTGYQLPVEYSSPSNKDAGNVSGGLKDLEVEALTADQRASLLRGLVGDGEGPPEGAHQMTVDDYIARHQQAKQAALTEHTVDGPPESRTPDPRTENSP